MATTQWAAACSGVPGTSQLMVDCGVPRRERWPAGSCGGGTVDRAGWAVGRTGGALSWVGGGAAGKATDEPVAFAVGPGAPTALPAGLVPHAPNDTVAIPSRHAQAKRRWRVLLRLVRMRRIVAMTLCVVLGWSSVADAAVPTLPGPSQPSVRAIAPTPHAGYWQVRAAPGQRVRLVVMVRNAGRRQATFQLGATGAGTGPTTGVGYTLGTGPTAGWLVGLPTSVTLGPGQAKTISATLVVPHWARVPYQYVGGVEALGAASVPPKAARVRIAERDAAVVAWVVTVGAPRVRRIAFGTPRVGGGPAPHVDFPATNTGQVLWAPQVSLSVRLGPCGRPGPALVSVVRQWGVTVPGTSWTYPLPLNAALAPGHYCALEQALGGPVEERAFVVTPSQHRAETSSPGEAKVATVGGPKQTNWLVSGLVLLVAVLLLAVLWLALGRRRAR